MTKKFSFGVFKLYLTTNDKKERKKYEIQRKTTDAKCIE